MVNMFKELSILEIIQQKAKIIYLLYQIVLTINYTNKKTFFIL